MCLFCFSFLVAKLCTGGYLVLESPNVGLVVAASSRFYTTVSSIGSSNDDANSGSDENTTIIVVNSPQFHSTWQYTLTVGSDDSFLESGEILLSPLATNSSENQFVEKTLRIVIAYLVQEGGQREGKRRRRLFPSKLDITIRADNDFYSVIPHLEGRPRTPETVDSLPRFLNCPLDQKTGKAIVNKTGLGSSAALVTSLVGALFHHFHSPTTNDANDNSQAVDDDDGDDDEDESNDTQLIIHNLAQLCHCHAQGKVGSGFDVSAAIHGTHVYKRFPKCVLPDVLNQLSSSSNHHQLRHHNDPTTNVSGSTAQLLANVVQSSWCSNMQTPLALPKGIQLLLADVCGGSESPSMARKVIAWKQQQFKEQGPTNIPHWSDLIRINKKIVQLMQDLSGLPPIDTETISQLPASEWKNEEDGTATSLLRQLHDSLMESRIHLRQLGEAAGVPIEPPEQTELCDATMKLPGVIAAVVPGAGGYDAVACLYVDTPLVKAAIGSLWETWNTNDQVVCPLSVQASSFGLQVVNEEEL